MSPPTLRQMSDEETARLLGEYRRSGNVDLRNRVIEAHGWLALVCARRLRRRNEPLDDLVQVANIGILKAAERYDPTFGVLFRTYASATAYGELRRHYRGTWRLRVARGTQELHLDVIGAIDHLTARNGTSPTLQEVATYLGREYDDVVDAYVAGANHQPLTLDAVHREDSSEHRESPYLSRVDPAFDDVLDRSETDRLVAVLPPRLQEIVRLRFHEQLSQSEIAARVGASQVHISRLLRDAIERMRAAARG